MCVQIWTSQPRVWEGLVLLPKYVGVRDMTDKMSDALLLLPVSAGSFSFWCRISCFGWRRCVSPTTPRSISAAPYPHPYLAPRRLTLDQPPHLHHHQAPQLTELLKKCPEVRSPLAGFASRNKRALDAGRRKAVGL